MFWGYLAQVIRSGSLINGTKLPTGTKFPESEPTESVGNSSREVADIAWFQLRCSFDINSFSFPPTRSSRCLGSEAHIEHVAAEILSTCEMSTGHANRLWQRCFKTHSQAHVGLIWNGKTQLNILLPIQICYSYLPKLGNMIPDSDSIIISQCHVSRTKRPRYSLGLATHWCLWRWLQGGLIDCDWLWFV